MNIDLIIKQATQAIRLGAIGVFLFFVYEGLFRPDGGSTQIFIGVAILSLVLVSCFIIDKLGEIKR